MVVRRATARPLSENSRGRCNLLQQPALFLAHTADALRSEKTRGCAGRRAEGSWSGWRIGCQAKPGRARAIPENKRSVVAHPADIWRGWVRAQASIRRRY